MGQLSSLMSLNIILILDYSLICCIYSKDGIEMAECAAYGTAEFAPPTATKDQKQQESEDQAHVYDVVSPVAVQPA